MDSIRSLNSVPGGEPAVLRPSGKKTPPGDASEEHFLKNSVDSLSEDKRKGWQDLLKGGRFVLKAVDVLSYHSLTKDVLDAGGILMPSGLSSALHATGVVSNSLLGVLAVRDLKEGIKKKDVQTILESGGEVGQSAAMVMGNAGLLVETGAAITGGKVGSLLKTAASLSSKVGFLATGLGVFGCALSGAAGVRELKEGIHNKDKKEILLGVLDTATAVASAASFTGVASLPAAIACLALYGLRSYVEHSKAIKSGINKIKLAVQNNLSFK
ncbi:MAG: hypothetical protein V2A78_11765 [bacterium]